MGVKTVYIIGGGSSLRSVNFMSLRGKHTIAVNLIYRVLPFYATHIVWTDLLVTDSIQAEIVFLASDMYTSDGRVKGISGVSLVRPAREWTDEFVLGGSLYYGVRGITGTLAISLALALGYKKIYLVGYDGSCGTSWYDLQGKLYRDYSVDLEPFKKYDIVNCSLDSSVPWFKKQSLKECL